MDLTPERAASAAESVGCPTCAAPAGSPCRTRGGNTAHRYHTPRPELERALRLAADTRRAKPDLPVVLTVHRLNRFARNATELMAHAATLAAGRVRLELLTGPLAGIHDPGGAGRMFFAVLGAAAGLDRDHLREKSLEGQRAAAARGSHGGRPRVFDDEMLAAALELRDRGVPVPEIAERLTIGSGKNAGQHPSLASVYRALAEPPHLSTQDSHRVAP